MIHFMDGQVILPILAAVLFLKELNSKNNFAPLQAIEALLLSTKIFTLVPAIRFQQKIKTLAVTAAFAIGLTTLTAWRTGDSNVLHHWIDAATSGATLLPAGDTRDAKNQNLTNFICNVVDIQATDTRSELLIAMFLCGLLLALLYWAHLRNKKNVNGTSLIEWPLLFAVPPLIHPLSWSHLYLFALPLFLYSVTIQSSLNKTKPLRAIGWLLISVFFFSDPKLGMMGSWLHHHFFRALACLGLWCWVLFAQNYRQPSVMGKANASC
jgi:hypothetical protein